MTMNKNDIDLGSIVLGDVIANDYPDFCDAYLESARWKSGKELTEDECIEFGERFPEVINEEAFQTLLD